MDDSDRHVAERWVPEPAKRPGRTPFARDRARVLHSAGLRRLAAKTQVVGPGSDDFVRTRLTHSLEVAQIGRELGQSFGCDPDLVEAACLAHDIGHPPFGHNGEVALDRCAESIGGFEGNAQTLRLLTRLEAKTPGAGLNLTRGTLDAATKYPWRRGAGPGDPDRSRHGRTVREKFGVYDDDLPVFEWLRIGAPPGARCLEAQVMDFADDVAYSVHDVEDGIVSGRIPLAALGSEVQRREIWRVARDWTSADATEDELEQAYDRLRRSGCWPTQAYDGTRAALGSLKNATSALIGQFCGAAERATRERYGDGPLTRYAAALMVPAATRLEIGVLEGIVARYVMRADDHTRLQSSQRAVIRELVDALVARAPEGLEPMFAADFAAAADDRARLRVIVDQVASLTDVSALDLHARLTG